MIDVMSNLALCVLTTYISLVTRTASYHHAHSQQEASSGGGGEEEEEKKWDS